MNSSLTSRTISFFRFSANIGLLLAVGVGCPWGGLLRYRRNIRAVMRHDHIKTKDSFEYMETSL